MNKLFLLLLCSLFLMSSCGDKNATCIMKEALVTYPPDAPYFKRFFTHNGFNYTETTDYLYDTDNDKYYDLPYQVVEFIYTNGKVSKTIRRNPMNSSTRRVESTFTYTVVDEITNVSVTEKTYDGDVFIRERTIDGHYFESPEDGVYLTKNDAGQPILEQYENGNLVGIGFQSADGTYEAYDTTWAFTIQYNYDNQPNAISEPVLLDLISYLPNNGYCTNNVIELVINPDTQPISITQEFNLKVDNTLNNYVYQGTGRKVTITYECK